jgi:putative ATP-dependent endonuclease of OLD family
MIILSIKISNVYSFEYKENIEQCENLIFDSSFNIIIGPNGAGKSNLVEIINQLFKIILIKPFIINEEYIELNNQQPNQYPLTNILTERSNIHSSLQKNNNSSSKNSKIRILIELSKDDLNNIVFIRNNLTSLKELGNTYSYYHDFSAFENNINMTELHSHTITLDVIKENNEQFKIDLANKNEEWLLFCSYIRNIDYIQNLIFLGNKYKNYTWNSLKNTFAIIGSNRNYNNIDPKCRPAENVKKEESEIRLKIINEGTKTAESAEPSIFPYIKHKICNHYQDIKIEEDNKKDITKYNISIDKLEKYPIYKSIRNALLRLLNLNLRLNTTRNGYEFILKKTIGPLIFLIKVQGKKGILHFVFSLFGSDLEEGLIIIDEPELHLHPSMYLRYLKLLQDIQKEKSLQIIIITHSVILSMKTP